MELNFNGHLLNSLQHVVHFIPTFTMSLELQPILPLEQGLSLLLKPFKLCQQVCHYCAVFLACDLLPLPVVYCAPAAPTAAPTQLRVSNFDSSTIALVWEPPPFTDRNGDIVRYRLRVTEQETQTIFEYSSTSQHYTLTSLHPYYNYVISIAAETVGVGPFTTGLLQPTMESGEFHSQSYRPDTLPEVWHKTLEM